MRTFLSAALASVIFVSSALAEDATNSLTPGKPAGVKQAQFEGINPIYFAGVGLIGIAILIAADHSSHNGGSSTVSSSTTGTSP